MQRIVLMPALFTGPYGAFPVPGRREILTGRTAAYHVKRRYRGRIDLCNISQIQCFICAMDRTVTLYRILIKLTKINQTIFHSSYFMRCSYTFYLGLLTYFLLFFIDSFHFHCSNAKFPEPIATMKYFLLVHTI